MSNARKTKAAPVSRETPRSEPLGKGRYAIFQTAAGEGVISYRPDGAEEDSHQVIPAKFWTILMGILSGEIKELGAMAMLKMLAGGK